MRKDESPADSDVCFSDIWSAAQHARSDAFRAIITQMWRRMLPPTARPRPKRTRNLLPDPRGKVGA